MVEVAVSSEIVVRVKLAAVQAVKPERPLRYSSETLLEMQRQDREWLRSARPTDSDWELGHVLPGERG
jgi:hypothetical protein